MTETNDSPVDVVELDDPHVQVSSLPTDILLSLLVGGVNAVPGFRVPVTLIVGGLLVTGDLVSGHDVLEDFKTLIGQAFARHGVENPVREVFETLQQNYATPDRPEPERKRGPEFVHLANAQVYQGNVAVPTKGGVSWRCRLSDVSGFTIGTLSRQQSI